jgi:hypothetical protein
VFTAPLVNLYSRDVERTTGFYADLGFVESFRTPMHGAPDHVELKLEGLTLGVGSAEARRRDHDLDIRIDEAGRGVEIVLWTHRRRRGLRAGDPPPPRSSPHPDGLASQLTE